MGFLRFMDYFSVQDENNWIQIYTSTIVFFQKLIFPKKFTMNYCVIIFENRLLNFLTLWLINTTRSLFPCPLVYWDYSFSKNKFDFICFYFFLLSRFFGAPIFILLQLLSLLPNILRDILSHVSNISKQKSIAIFCIVISIILDKEKLITNWWS